MYLIHIVEYIIVGHVVENFLQCIVKLFMIKTDIIFHTYDKNILIV